MAFYAKALKALPSPLHLCAGAAASGARAPTVPSLIADYINSHVRRGVARDHASLSDGGNGTCFPAWAALLAKVEFWLAAANAVGDRDALRETQAAPPVPRAPPPHSSPVRVSKQPRSAVDATPSSAARAFACASRGDDLDGIDAILALSTGGARGTPSASLSELCTHGPRALVASSVWHPPAPGLWDS